MHLQIFLKLRIVILLSKCWNSYKRIRKCAQDSYMYMFKVNHRKQYAIWCFESLNTICQENTAVPVLDVCFISALSSRFANILTCHLRRSFQISVEVSIMGNSIEISCLLILPRKTAFTADSRIDCDQSESNYKFHGVVWMIAVVHSWSTLRKRSLSKGFLH